MRPDITSGSWRRYGSRLGPILMRFSLVGGSGVIVNSFALYAFFELGHLPLILASSLAVELAIVNNFLWNNWWTFGQQKISPRRFLLFNLISLGGLVITTTTLYLLTSYGVYYLLANLLGVGLATFWNFGLNLLWTWRWQG